MYDLEIAVPAETNEAYIRDRLEDYKKFGLLNIKDRKIKLVLLCSIGNKVEFLRQGFPAGVEVDIIHTPYKHVAQRIHYYYGNYIKPNTAKWYVRMDEDSITDVDSLMVNLENEFDHERDYHLGGEVTYDVSELEKAIVQELGYEHWYWEDAPGHEYEISVTSNSAMQKILSHENAIQYFQIRQKISDGFGDQGLCLCARMAKVPTTKVAFLSKDPELYRLSLFNGKLNHIHYTARDQNPHIYNWLGIIDQEITNKNKNDFLGKKALIDKDGDSKWIYFKDLRFNEVKNKETCGIWGITKNNELSLHFRDWEFNNKLLKFKRKGNEFHCDNFKITLLGDNKTKYV